MTAAIKSPAPYKKEKIHFAIITALRRLFFIAFSPPARAMRVCVHVDGLSPSALPATPPHGGVSPGVRLFTFAARLRSSRPACCSIVQAYTTTCGGSSQAQPDNCNHFVTTWQTFNKKPFSVYIGMPLFAVFVRRTFQAILYSQILCKFAVRRFQRLNGILYP